MIAVQKVIRKLVSDYEFVIIPGFGALLSHQIPAIYDRDSGVFSPPVKKLAFNEFLKLDDGLLANFISREENISHVEAVAHVKNYADVLRSSLDANGETGIEGIGEFKTNSEGKLVFEPNTENYFKDEWYGFQKVSARIVERNIFTAADSAVLAEGDDAEIIEISNRKRVKITWMRWSAVAVLAGMALFISFFLLNSGSAYNKSTLNPFDYFNKESTAGDYKASPQKQEQPVKNETVVVVDEVIQDKKEDSLKSSPELVPVNSEIDAEAAPSVIADKKYYLIAGAFKGKKQAGVLLKTLQDKGFENAFLIPASVYSKKVKVAVQGFDEEKDAYRASSRLREVIGEDGWVYKKK